MSSVVINDFDDILKEIAKALFTNSDIDDLGKALGFEDADIGRAIDENTRQGGNYMGTYGLLKKWRRRQTSLTEKAALRSALVNAGFDDLASKYLITPITGSPEEEPENDVAAEKDDDTAPNGVHVLPEAPSRKRKGSPPEHLPKRRDRSLKEAMDKILTVSREQDETYRKEAAAARQNDERTSREELDTLKQMMELTRMQLEFQREEAVRKDRREREDREREEKRWALFYTNPSTRPQQPAHGFSPMTHQTFMPHHTSTQQPPHVFPPHTVIPSHTEMSRRPAPSTFTPLASVVQGPQSTWARQPPLHQHPPHSTHDQSSTKGNRDGDQEMPDYHVL